MKKKKMNTATKDPPQSELEPRTPRSRILSLSTWAKVGVKQTGEGPGGGGEEEKEGRRKEGEKKRRERREEGRKGGKKRRKSAQNQCSPRKVKKTHPKI